MGAYYSLKGQYYSIHTALASGGEGTVYSLLGHDDLVAKIYAPSTFKENQDRKKQEKKLRAMLNMHIKINPDGVTRIAWPQDILYDTDDNLAGFTMPKVNATYKIYDIYRGGKGAVRDQIYPDYTWKYSVQFAYHLAWIVDYVHSYNIVIADLNPNNIVVDTIANTIVLIDCDSFDITYDGEHFPCLVGLPEVLAPEIQPAGRVVNGLFSKQSDNFSLAVHIFRLLMNNEDPFGGVITTDESMSSIVADRAICNGECPYVRSVPGRSIPRRAPSLEMLPPEIRDLFQKTFNYTAITAIKNIPRRADAKEWCLALASYGAPDPNPRLKTCSADPKHVYPVHNKECPWCKIEALEAMDEKSLTAAPLSGASASLLFDVFDDSSSKEPVLAGQSVRKGKTVTLRRSPKRSTVSRSSAKKSRRAGIVATVIITFFILATIVCGIFYHYDILGFKDAVTSRVEWLTEQLSSEEPAENEGKGSSQYTIPGNDLPGTELTGYDKTDITLNEEYAEEMNS